MPPENHPAFARIESIRQAVLPTRNAYHPSPTDWRDHVLYFLLPDRFSDGSEATRPLLKRDDLAAGRPPLLDGTPWRWDNWAKSGASRGQGGTLQGVRTKLLYLKRLGVTVIWIAPVFKQRVQQDTYHGYGVQDFLEIDPHLGTRQDLIDLIDAAHENEILVILDVIFNHSGANWVYPTGERTPPYKPYSDRYSFGHWLNGDELEVDTIQSPDDGVWPVELQDKEYYTRAGKGDLGSGDIDDPHAEHKRSDFFDLRDFNLSGNNALSDLALCYKYWIALTDCDGFRIDTLKHVTYEEARNFCGSIKEFAASLGKNDFFLVAEVAGGDYNESRYLNAVDRNINAVLDIGEMRRVLHGIAKGTEHPERYFIEGFDPSNDRTGMGSHRNLGLRHVSVLDDHDHVSGDRIRFSSNAASDHQVVAGVALQLFSLGIPCIYYGTEQAFAGPEPSERAYLPNWDRADGLGQASRYLREAMFGPAFPRRHGREGLVADAGGLDTQLPGFGPFGTAGLHCFDERSPAYLRIAALTAARQRYAALRYGRQYLRPLSVNSGPFNLDGSGLLVAWSRILGGTEALCIINSDGVRDRGADILVDAGLNPEGSSMIVVLNTAQAASSDADSLGDPYRVETRVLVRKNADGVAYVEIAKLGPSEVLVLLNRHD